VSVSLRGGARRLREVVRSSDRPAHPQHLITAADEAYLTTPFDATVPLPADADQLRSPDNPRLRELRAAYGALDIPPVARSRWTHDAVDGFLDLRYFRGDSLITWHYRELPRATMLKYFLYAQYVAGRDPDGLLGRLGEDGAFGCWTFDYPGHPRYSRDLIESVGEIAFLERELGLSRRERFSVLDIGAGYGRLAHRMSQAYPNLADYCCVDAIPESTFVCEYYLSHRECTPARVVPLHEIDGALAPGTFDLAVNVHSFPECTFEAIGWWIERVAGLRVPWLFIVPNEPGQLLSLEPDGSRRDFAPLLERAGYEPHASEPVIRDPAIRDLVRVHDTFHLFARRD
jgi:SAM-dependent methyltransferase